MISQITDILKDANIENLMNKSKKDIAYTIIDLDTKVDITPIEKINGMIKVSTYKKQDGTMIDAHTHLENGDLSIEYVCKFIDAAKEKGITHLQILDHTLRFFEFKDCY